MARDLGDVLSTRAGMLSPNDRAEIARRTHRRREHCESPLASAHAEVVLFAVAAAEHGSNTPMASMTVRRMYMQKPTAVGSSGYMGTAAHSIAALARSASSGGGLFSQNRGNEQISALFESGVIVPMCGSDAAQQHQPVEHWWVTTVSGW